MTQSFADGGGTMTDRSSVLIVDDDDNTRQTLKIALREEGYEVHEAATGSEALELAAAVPIDVILLDQVLPDLPGREVLRLLRATAAGVAVPVIFVTGRREPADRIEGLDAGADDYITKPFRIDELLARVNAQVRGRNVWRQRVEVLRERSLTASTLARVGEHGTTADVAADVASTLTTLRDVRQVDVFEVNHDGTASVLASAAAPGSTPRPVPTAPEPLADLSGADVRPALSAGAGVVAIPALDHAAAQEAVVCRLGDRDPPIGAVLLATSQRSTGGAPSPPASDVLAAMAELGPIVERLLVRRLEFRGSMESEMAKVRALLTSESFETAFQPIVDVYSGDPVGYEALTRFADGVRPDLRFEEARRCGLGVELEIAALRRALTRAATLPPGLYVSVNLSASTLMSSAVPRVDELVGGGRPLVIEITEHEHVNDYLGLRAALSALGPGVGLAVDDAGSGYASLRHVLALRPDVVKLDRGWVSGIEADPARQALIAGVVSFVARLGGSVVAEGVESDAELAALKELGVRYAQGYLLGRPELVPVSAGGSKAEDR